MSRQTVGVDADDAISQLVTSYASHPVAHVYVGGVSILIEDVEQVARLATVVMEAERDLRAALAKTSLDSLFDGDCTTDAAAYLREQKAERLAEEMQAQGDSAA